MTLAKPLFQPYTRLPQANFGETDREFQKVQRGINQILQTYGARVYPVTAPPFGAPANGVQDDCVAAQAAANAISAAGGGIVYFPPGGYLFASRLNLIGLHNVAFLGAGPQATAIQPKLNPGPLSGFQCSLFSSFPDPNQPVNTSNFLASNISWDGMTLDMNYNVIPDGGVAHTSYGTPPYQYAADNYQYPIYAFVIDGVTIGDNMKFINGWYDGIEIYQCNRVKIGEVEIDHVGDKANYLGNYSGIEIDDFCHSVRITKPLITNGGQGIFLSAAHTGTNPDGISGQRDVIIESPTIRTMVSGGIDANNYIDNLQILHPVIRNVGTAAISVRFTDAGTNGAIGPRGVQVVSPEIRDYNTSQTNGVGALDLNAATLSVSNVQIRNSIPSGTGKTFYGVIIRQLTETVGGLPVNRYGSQVRGVIADGSFENGYAVLDVADYSTVDGVTVHDTSSGMISAVDSTGAHSPAPTNVLTIP